MEKQPDDREAPATGSDFPLCELEEVKILAFTGLIQDGKVLESFDLTSGWWTQRCRVCLRVYAHQEMPQDCWIELEVLPTGPSMGVFFTHPRCRPRETG